MMKRAKTAERRLETAAEEKSSLLHNIERMDDLKLFPLRHHARRLLTLADAAPCYDGRPVCAPTSLEIMQGERIRLTGGNGAGKSSLLRLLAGKPQDYTGTLLRASGLIISYVPQRTDTVSGSLRTFAEEIDYSLFLTILRKLGFARAQFEKDLSELSAGQKKRCCSHAVCASRHTFTFGTSHSTILIWIPACRLSGC